MWVKTHRTYDSRCTSKMLSTPSTGGMLDPLRDTDGPSRDEGRPSKTGPGRSAGPGRESARSPVGPRCRGTRGVQDRVESRVGELVRTTGPKDPGREHKSSRNADSGSGTRPRGTVLCGSLLGGARKRHVNTPRHSGDKSGSLTFLAVLRDLIDGTFDEPLCVWDTHLHLLMYQG